MARSATERVLSLADSIRDLRGRVQTLALFLLEDEHGISERSMEQLQLLCKEVGGCVKLSGVHTVNGRVSFATEEA